MKTAVSTRETALELAAIHARSFEAQYAAYRLGSQMGRAQGSDTRAIRFAMDVISQIVDCSDTWNDQSAHLDDLLGAGTVRLSAWEMEEFDKEYAKIDLMGHRADPFTESQIDK